MAKFTTNFISYTLQRAVDITVVIPSVTIPESMGLTGEKPTHAGKAPFPVLYLLHGYGNNHATWTGYSNVEMYAEEHQVAVVNVSAENKAYSLVGGDDFFTFISEELPEFVRAMFPVSTRPEDTYIAGLSMGGYGALYHGLSHPERFAAIGAFSAATMVDAESFSRMPLGVDVGEAALKPGADDTVPEKLADRIAAEGRTFPKMYMACGKQDFLHAPDKALCEHLRELGADVTWDETEEHGHEWRFWDLEVEKFLKWLPRTDAYAAAGSRTV